MDGQAHATVEKRRREAAVHRAPWIEVSVCRVEREDDAASFGLHHVIAQGPCEGVERQRSAGKARYELQPLFAFLCSGLTIP